MKKKVVLAYSGGLDTTYCALYLSKTLGYEVHAVTVNTGGFTAEEIQTIEQKALSLGIASYRCVDSVVEYYESCVKYLLFGNVLKNNTYPLSVSAERTIQAKVIAEYALEVGAGLFVMVVPELVMTRFDLMWFSIFWHHKWRL